jgi:hypothetical protein
MDSTLLLLGIACIIAAIVGGGLKAVGFEFPALSSIGRQFALAALGVILVLVSRSYVPNSPDVPKAQPVSPSAEAATTPGPVEQSGGMLAVRVVVTPPAVQSGEKATVYAEVMDPNGNRVEGASVIFAAGGGRFLESADTAYSSTENLQGPFSAGGRTSVSGAYTTWWVCRPCAPAYGLTVKASKSGFIEGSAEATVRIH